MKLIIDVGDIIHQTRDNIIFTIIARDKNRFTLEYYDNYIKNIKIIFLTREQLRRTFKNNANDLKLIRVIK
jgi:hypothetical protein